MVTLSAPRRYRIILSSVLALALLACLYVGIVRERKEAAARRVEIAMDYSDFSALAQSYGYAQSDFLIALRRAGLTSLAVSEELGGTLSSGSTAFAQTGAQILAAGRLGEIGDTAMRHLIRSGAIRPSAIYLFVLDPSALARYRTNLIEHLGAHAVRQVAGTSRPILAVDTQSDYFSNLGLGLPERPLALARDLHLYLVPRVQNDERFGAPQIDRIFASFKVHERPSTVIFFGQRNEVLGFPDHLDDTADAFRRSGLNFGTIETYDKTQVQKGNDGLAEKVIAQTARVQAISKTELDKLDYDTVVARYLLGVRERNVRVVYLRPFLHEQNGMSIEKTNVALVADIARGLRARGFTLGRAMPIPAFRINPFVVALAALAVPAIFALLFEAFGVRRSALAYVLFGGTIVLLLAGYAIHHDLLARKLLALAGAIGFATMGVVAVARSFVGPPPKTFGACVGAGMRTFAIATGVALGGALVVVGLVSTPLLMEEIDRFAGVKAVIVVPPLVAFCLYVYTRRFGREPLGAQESAQAPVRVYQLAILAVLAVAGFIYISRSGNQSDVSPSAFELALRSNLTSLLGVRPRFKEFAIGFPMMILLPALLAEHKRATGWLFAICIAIGTSDVVDTFSHLHTPLVVSLLRVFNGAVIGIAIGVVAIVVYRRAIAAASAAAARRIVRAR